MGSNIIRIPRPQSIGKTYPFESAEEAWFWFIEAQQARVDGARFTVGLSLVPRPCEPVDILKILDRLYRARKLLWEHLLILRHYGRRRLAPEKNRIKEARAHTLWAEALGTLSDALEEKGIVRSRFQQMVQLEMEALENSGVAAE